MKNMRVLIDSNIIVDVVQERKPFCLLSKEIIARCIKSEIEGYVSAHSLCDIFYILRKDKTIAERLSLISNLCKYLNVISEKKDDFEVLANNPETKDLEDGLQMQCAKTYSLDYIITRNVKDFEKSEVPAIEPFDFLVLLDRM